jgi:hypothetical protein
MPGDAMGEVLSGRRKWRHGGKIERYTETSKVDPASGTSWLISGAFVWSKAFGLEM